MPFIARFLINFLTGMQDTEAELSGWTGLTAQRGDGCIDRLHEDAVVGDLKYATGQNKAQYGECNWVGLTSSMVLASRRIHPNSMTSAESLVT